MPSWSLKTQSYFDGKVLHDRGPYYILIEKGRFAAISTQKPGPEFSPQEDVAFLMPGLVEAHAHLFLNGATLDFSERSAFMKKPVSAMMDVARENVLASLAAGITLIRDAGDRFGVNHQIRSEVNNSGDGPVIRSAGLAIHRAGNYGKFMSRPVGDADDIRATIADIAKTSDDLKIILTGIIDFEKGRVTAPVQFSVEELKLIISVAADHGLPTFAHCSGAEGVQVATAAGIGSIEHGFFLDRTALMQAAEKDIAWVPTFSPVHFQWANPQYAKWSEQSLLGLRKILDDHEKHCEMAGQIGAPIVAGSDAGSQGVPHGAALIDELLHFDKSGLPMTEVLISATSRPRQMWGGASNWVATAEPAEFITLGASPFDNPSALKDVQLVVRNGRILHRK